MKVWAAVRKLGLWPRLSWTEASFIDCLRDGDDTAIPRWLRPRAGAAARAFFTPRLASTRGSQSDACPPLYPTNTYTHIGCFGRVVTKSANVGLYADVCQSKPAGLDGGDCRRCGVRHRWPGVFSAAETVPERASRSSATEGSRDDHRRSPKPAGRASGCSYWRARQPRASKQRPGPPNRPRRRQPDAAIRSSPDLERTRPSRLPYVSSGELELVWLRSRFH